MKLKTIKIIYIIYFLLLIFFIYQELVPILFIIPSAPGSFLILLNFPLTTAIILALIPIFTARAFVRALDTEYSWLSSIKLFLLILIFSALLALFLPYVTFIGFKTDIGLVYSFYSGVLGLFLIFFEYIQLITKRIFFGFLIGTAGSTMGLSNHFKIFIYALQQYDTILEVGYYIGIIAWIMLFLLNLTFTLKLYTSNQIQ